MEPTLVGPRLVGDCNACRTRFSLAEEITLRVTFARCPHCDAVVDLVDSVERKPGQQVTIEPIMLSSRLHRGDLVIFDDSTIGHEPSSTATHAPSRSVKRLAGFPGESIRITDGDLFVDGRRHQKSADDFYRMAVHVDSWDFAVDCFSDDSGPIRSSVYESTSLWPRIGERAIRHASPILDELSTNTDEPFEFVQVHDIGMLMQFETFPLVHFDMAISIWSRDALRSVQLRFSPTRCDIAATMKTSESIPVVTSWNLPEGVNGCGAIRLLAATVDGRFIVALLDDLGLAVRSHYWTLDECIGDRLATNGAGYSSERPIVVSVRGTHPQLRIIHVIRDIHYRGPNGEYDYPLSIVDAYHVLGDNVSISSDSRSQLSEGIERNRISARVILEPPGHGPTLHQAAR